MAQGQKTPEKAKGRRENRVVLCRFQSLESAVDIRSLPTQSLEPNSKQSPGIFEFQGQASTSETITQSVFDYSAGCLTFLGLLIGSNFRLQRLA